MPKIRIKKQAILTLAVLFTITQKWRSRDPDPSFIDLNNNGDNSNLSIGRNASSRTEWTDADEISSLKQEAHQTSRPQSTPFRPVRWIVGPIPGVDFGGLERDSSNDPDVFRSNTEPLSRIIRVLRDHQSKALNGVVGSFVMTKIW